MILAVAALTLHITSAALTMPAAAAAGSAAPANAAAQPDTSTTTTTSVAQFSFDNVSLSTSSKESSSSPKLNAVAFNTSKDSDTLSTIRIPEIQPTKPEEVKMAETPRYTKSWMALSLVQHAAAEFDAYSTRQAIGRGAVEDDPLMRPFAHSPAIYAAIQAGPVALDLISHRMQHSEVGVVRRMWWVPQSISSGMFIFAGFHNLGVSARQ
jgi:hypothetical protein